MSKEKKEYTENINIQKAIKEAKSELHGRERIIEQPKESSQSDIKNFVQDKFFEKGHLWLKIRQVLINLLFLGVLVIPVMILFNSLANGQLWTFLHHWTYQDGFALTNYLQSFILLAVLVILVLSLAFLLRNNYREQKVYPKKRTYDEELLNKRKEILYEMYAERFGDKEFRESTKYYAVDGEKNIDDHLIEELFKDNGVEIK
jgi:hypothetical protein